MAVVDTPGVSPSTSLARCGLCYSATNFQAQGGIINKNVPTRTAGSLCCPARRHPSLFAKRYGHLRGLDPRDCPMARGGKVGDSFYK